MSPLVMNTVSLLPRSPLLDLLGGLRELADTQDGRYISFVHRHAVRLGVLYGVP